MASSHRDRCPLDWDDLRYLRLSHVGFDGRAHTGELVVAASQADTVVRRLPRPVPGRLPDPPDAPRQ